MIAWRWVPAFAAALLFVTVAAADEPSEGEKKAAAQALFDEGRQLTAAGQFAEACPKFVESKRLDPSMGTKFYLADCFEHVGKLASAWTYYLEVADLARAGGQADREKFANERADALKPRLARLVIKVSAAVRALPGLAITRDGVGVGEAQWGIGIPIDQGEHVVTVTATDRLPAEIKIEATREGALVEVPVPLPEPVAAPPPPPPPLPPPPPPSAAPRIAGFVVGGAGIVGVALGAVFGMQALGKKSDSNADGHCDSNDTCDAMGLALRSEGLKAATASTVSFVIGGLALSGGIVLIATAPRASGTPLPAAVPSVALGPRTASLAWRW